MHADKEHLQSNLDKGAITKADLATKPNYSDLSIMQREDMLLEPIAV